MSNDNTLPRGSLTVKRKPCWTRLLRNLLALPADAPPLVYALAYGDAGFAVFPCRDRPNGLPAARLRKAKSPLTRNGFTDASSDANRITAWWTKSPTAMIGLPTGPVNGFWALDIDTHGDGYGALEDLADRHGEKDAVSMLDFLSWDGHLCSRTPSGGMHVLYLWDDATAVRSAAGEPAASLDTRGTGGYIIAPGSKLADGRKYEMSLKDLKAIGGPHTPPTWVLDEIRSSKRDAEKAPPFADDQPVKTRDGETPAPWPLVRLVSRLDTLDPALEGSAYGTVIDIIRDAYRGTAEFNAAREITKTWAKRAAAVWAKAPGNFDSRWSSTKKPDRDGVTPATLATLDYWAREGTNTVEGHDPEAEALASAVEGFDDLPNEAVETKPKAADRGAFRFIRIGQSVQNREPVTWTVQDLVPANSFGVIFAQPKKYKSVFAGDIGAHIAAGRDFHGRAVTAGPVLYMAGEGVHATQDRIIAWCNHHGVDIETLPMHITDRGIPLCHAKAAAPVVAEIERVAKEEGAPPRLVIIDTLAKHFKGNESSAEDMNAFVNTIEQCIRGRFNTTVIVVHHAGHHATERAKGSIALLGGVDFEYRVDRKDLERRYSVVCTAMRRTEEPAAIDFDVESLTIDFGGEEIIAPVSVLAARAPPIDDHEYGSRPKLIGLRGTMYQVLEQYPAGLSQDELFEIVAGEAQGSLKRGAKDRRDQLNKTFDGLKRAGHGVKLGGRNGLYYTAEDAAVASATEGFDE